MSNEDYTHVPLPDDPGSADTPLPPDAPAFPPPADDPPESADARETGNVRPDAPDAPPCSPALGERVGGKPKLPGLCHHRMESGYYCQSPALRDRLFCYSHLRLRGQRFRVARAIARGLPYRFELPALDDLYAVQVAVEHVGRTLAAGLMKRADANSLLWMLQQSAINHRNLASARSHAGAMDPSLAAGAPPLSPAFGDRLGDNQKRLVEEYPEFEAEFGLPAGTDVSQPAHVLFPPPEDVWRVPTPARDPETSPWCHRQPSKHWTKDEIEREQLQKRKDQLDRVTYDGQLFDLNQKIARQEQTAFRRHQEAAWQAEADRRNAALQERERQFASMNEGERQAYNLGVFRAMEAVQEEEEKRENWRKEYADKVS